MPATIDNQSGTISTLVFLVGNARTLIMTAMVVSLFLFGGNQIGTALAQPVSDPLTVFTSSGFESWSSVSEEAEWSVFAPKVVLATGPADAFMYISEENDSLRNLAKVVIATGQAYISEENDSLRNSPKVAIAIGQAYISEENDSLRNSPKIALATRPADAFMYISEENDSLRNSPKLVLATRQAFISEENEFEILS